MTRRGYHADDRLLFGGDQLELLQRAQQEIRWLLDRGYKANPVLDLVGGHHQLTARQRNALQRTTASGEQCRRRAVTRLPMPAVRDQEILIDGFNIIITLETALSGSLLVRGNDGVVRDLAGLRGTYRIIPQTEQALAILGRGLAAAAPARVRIYLDAPVSNSGKLRQRILAAADSWPMPVEVSLVADPDAILCEHERVVTADSLILDNCVSWIDLIGGLIRESVPEAWIVSFSDPES